MNLSLKDNLKKSFWALWILLMFFGFGLLLIIGNYEFSVLVNSWHNNSLDFLFQNLTYLGDGVFVFLIAFVFIFFKKKLAILTLSSLSITTIIIQFLKMYINSIPDVMQRYISKKIDRPKLIVIDIGN